MLATRAETVSLGMAKPMPAEAPLGEMITVFMPMTSERNGPIFQNLPCHCQYP